MIRSIRFTFLGLFVLGGVQIALRSDPAPTRASQSGAADDQVILVVHAPDAARRASVVPVELFVVAPREGRWQLASARLFADGVALYELPLDAVLAGDSSYIELEQWIERLPEELTHRHGPRAFAASDAPLFPAAEWADRVQDIRARLADLRARARVGDDLPYRAVPLWLPLDQLIDPAERGGRRLVFAFELDYRTPSGELLTARAEADLGWLGAPPSMPTGLLAAGTAGFTLHAGDLHVHSCHGEATNACSPSADCAAESFQTSGSFSYAQLKAQYQALGYDWFTATDHSYCINSGSEYQTIVAETAAITDANFVVLPDIEVSSDEVGSQVGSDVGDLSCIFGTQANHMGAHGISSRIAGGGDGFLGFCNGLLSDALEAFTDNVADIRAQGGYPIANHPTGSFGWNSFSATQGLEANQLHGVEIWNGALVSGQSGDVGRWVDWLLGGRILYGYSGSDTHDAGFAFGANWVALSGPLSTASLLEALSAGRSYVSNGPALLFEADLGPETLFMGTIQAVPSGLPPTTLTLRAAYDFGVGAGTVTIFTGGVGDGAETVACQSATLSGAGTFVCTAPLRSDASSWFRAYAENTGGDQVAYSNPVFFRLGLANIANYCTAKTNSQGCAPELSFVGTPSATWGAPFELRAQMVLNQKPGLAFFGLGPATISFQGATLCVAPPTKRGPLAFSAGNPLPSDCSGVLATDVNAIIQSGTSPVLLPGATVYSQVWYRDPADPAGFGTGLSNALVYTVQP